MPMRLVFLVLILAVVPGCITSRPMTLEERREAKARWERFAEESDDPY